MNRNVGNIMKSEDLLIDEYNREVGKGFFNMSNDGLMSRSTTLKFALNCICGISGRSRCEYPYDGAI